jgi:phosphatidylglycerophosphate synthase
VQDRNGFAAKKNLSTSNGLVTPRDSQSLLPQALAFQASETEELADAYFFRPLGLIVARFAAALRLTSLSAGVGILGGISLYHERLGLVAFALLILHSILDSADGQLARLTGRVTELGRVLDGVNGYVTHAAIYLGIAAGLLHRGGGGVIIIWMALAAIANTVHAQLYDYHRRHYAMIAGKGLVPRDDPAKIKLPWIKTFYRWHLATQRLLNGLHVEVESRIATRSTAGLVREDDRARYRDCFCRPVRGWNLLGDNTRFYAIGVLACLHRIDLFFAFVLLPMNLAFIALWLWQRSADRRFLARS